jgi:hypothetical protein
MAEEDLARVFTASFAALPRIRQERARIWTPLRSMVERLGGMIAHESVG